jgi:hypothetical protein
MPQKKKSPGDGFVNDVLPLVKDGFVILRSILDVMIERIEEAELSREIDVRTEIYSSIIDALEAEVENIEAGESETETSRAKLEVLEAVISALTKETEELETKSRRKSKRPHKVKID